MNGLLNLQYRSIVTSLSAEWDKAESSTVRNFETNKNKFQAKHSFSIKAQSNCEFPRRGNFFRSPKTPRTMDKSGAQSVQPGTRNCSTKFTSLEWGASLFSVWSLDGFNQRLIWEQASVHNNTEKKVSSRIGRETTANSRVEHHPCRNLTEKARGKRIFGLCCVSKEAKNNHRLSISY